MKNPDPRNVVRRKRSSHEAKHNSSWKIAYADFMTAMMAFFLVMWLPSLVPQKDLQAIAEYFRMPLMTAVTGGPKHESGTSVIPAGASSVISNPRPIPSRGDVHTEGDLCVLQRLAALTTEIE